MKKEGWAIIGVAIGVFVLLGGFMLFSSSENTGLSPDNPKGGLGGLANVSFVVLNLTFDSGNSSNYTNYANNNTNVSSSGNPMNVTGRFGNATFFNGINNSLDLGRDLGNFGTNSFSISFWIKDFNMGQNKMVMSKDNGYHRKGWAIYGLGNSRTILIINDGNYHGPTTIDPPSVGKVTNLNNGKWHHVAYTVDRTNHFMKSYQNGVLKEQRSIKPGTAKGISGSISNNRRFKIACTDRDGDYPCEANYGSFWLDELVIYNKTLSADEIKNIYQS